MNAIGTFSQCSCTPRKVSQIKAARPNAPANERITMMSTSIEPTKALVITKTMTKDSLVVTRAEQKEIPGWAEKFRTRKKAEKAAKAKGK